MSDDKPPLPPPPKDLPRRGNAFRHWKGQVYVVTGVSRDERFVHDFNVHYLPEGVSDETEIPWKRTYSDFTSILVPPNQDRTVRRFYPCGRREIPSFLRPEVAAFARAMEEKLRKNEHKGGWKDEAPRALLERAEDEIDELDLAVTCLRDEECRHHETEAAKRQNVLGEAADVANFCMMVANVCGALKP